MASDLLLRPELTILLEPLPRPRPRPRPRVAVPLVPQRPAAMGEMLFLVTTLQQRCTGRGTAINLWVVFFDVLYPAGHK